MTLGQFLWAHKTEIWASMASLLFVFSEFLGTNPNTQSNSIFQMIQGFLKKESGRL